MKVKNIVIQIKLKLRIITIYNNNQWNHLTCYLLWKQCLNKRRFFNVLNLKKHKIQWKIECNVIDLLKWIYTPNNHSNHNRITIAYGSFDKINLSNCINYVRFFRHSSSARCFLVIFMMRPWGMGHSGAFKMRSYTRSFALSLVFVKFYSSWQPSVSLINYVIVV